MKYLRNFTWFASVNSMILLHFPHLFFSKKFFFQCFGPRFGDVERALAFDQDEAGFKLLSAAFHLSGFRQPLSTSEL